jgi:hypothetical protein
MSHVSAFLDNLVEDIAARVALRVINQLREVPKVDAPKVDAPKVDAPKVDAPKVDAPKVDAPKVDAPDLRGQVEKAILTLLKKQGRDPVVKLLADFGVTRGRDLKDEDLVRFLEGARNGG